MPPVRLERCLFIFLLILLLPFTAKAYENLSLKEALKIAQGQNPEIILQRYEVYKAEASKLTAKQWTNPVFEVLFGGLPHTENNNTGFSKANLDWEFSVTQELDLLRKIKSRKKIAAYNYQLSLLDRKKLKIDVAYSIKNTFIEIVTIQNLLQVYGDLEDYSKKFLGSVQVKHKNNKATYSDALRAEIQVLNFKKNRVKLSNLLKAKKSFLNYLLGRPLNKSFAANSTKYYNKLPSKYESLVALAKDYRPEFQIVRQNINVSKEQRKLSRKNAVNNPSLKLFAEKDGPEKDYGFSLQFGLPLWHFNGGEAKKHQYDQKKHETELGFLDNKIGNQVKTAFLAYQSAQQEISVLKESFILAQELLRKTNQDYSEGEISFLNFLDKIKSSQEIQIEYYKTYGDLLTSRINLEYVTGIDLKNEVSQ